MGTEAGVGIEVAKRLQDRGGKESNEYFRNT